MDGHEALVTSLGEHCVDYIGKNNVRQLTATFDGFNGIAHVEICLHNDSWSARESAIDKMIEVREMFIDHVSVDYAFSDEGACVETEKSQAEYTYA